MSAYTGDVYTGAMANTAYGCATDTRVHNWIDPTVVYVYIPVTKFSSALRAMMTIENVTVKEIGKQIGVHESAVRHWCHGRRFPRKETLKKLCDFLSIDESTARMLIEQEKQNKKENKDEQA